MTMRQVDLALKHIGFRVQMDMKLEAALHGINIEMPAAPGTTDRVQLTDEQENMVAAAIERAKQRKHSEMNRGR